MFQHTAARRRLAVLLRSACHLPCGFNTQPPEGGWSFQCNSFRLLVVFQHTAARRRLGLMEFTDCQQHGFNTQPPEGGWTKSYQNCRGVHWFQHTAARRRLDGHYRAICCNRRFQHTAARRRLGRFIFRRV